MREFCTKNALNLKQGAIRELFDRAKDYADTINLGIGEPDFTTPEYIIDAGCEALRSGKTFYTANAGLMELREEIARYLKDCHIDRSPEKNIIVTIGAMGALALCMLTTICPGDEVLIQDPQWLNYRAQILFCGGVPVPVPIYENNSFALKAEDIEKRITDRTRMMVLNSPSNPTGAVVPQSEMEKIAELAVRHDLLILSDEVYSEIVYDGVQHCSIARFPGMEERTVIVNSFSKMFAMTGWRVGFAAGPETVIKKMTVLQENMVACVPSVSQYAAIKALKDRSAILKMREIYRERRDIIVEGLNSIPGITCIKPMASFYVFPNIKATGLSSKAFSEGLLEKTGVITIPGSAFGENGEGYLRVSYANSKENIVAALERIREFTAHPVSGDC